MQPMRELNGLPPKDLVEQSGRRYVGSEDDPHYASNGVGSTVTRRVPKLRGKAAVKAAKRARRA